MRAIALRSILYCSKMFNPGEVVEINDPDYLDLLRKHRSIRYENGSEEFDISEVATENDAETTETAAETTETAAETTETAAETTETAAETTETAAETTETVAETTETAAETTETAAETTETAAEEEAQKPIGRKGKR